MTVQPFARVALLLAVGFLPIGAQQRAELLLQDGRVVEVLGLRRWTLSMLQDSLARYAPGDSLHTHSCAATLRYKLGFADAASTTYLFRQDQPARIVVVVREPQDSARVHYRRVQIDTMPGHIEWRPVTDAMRTRPPAFWPMAYAFAAGDSATGQFRSREDSVAAKSMLRFLRVRNSQADFHSALRTLRTSPHVHDRAAAALSLANFPERDEAWHALLETLLESDGIAKSLAGVVLQQFAIRHARHVDWTGMEAVVRALLDGTSVFMLPTAIQALTATGVGPDQARLFLHEGGEMLTEYLGSGTPMLSGGAHQLLVQLRGADLGHDKNAWRAWIATL